jgi:threonine dehydratase
VSNVSASHNILNRAGIAAAATTLTGLVRRTPVMTVDGSAFGVDGLVSLKLEHLQHSGTFKARGAANFIAALAGRSPRTTESDDPEPAALAVTAASGGNHGVAVAWAASEQETPAHIFVPTIAAEAKVDRLRRYGAVVTQVGDVYADALAACVEFQTSSGAVAIHAYDDPMVAAGAGTVALEFESQIPPSRPALDAILVACGGGGLAGGIATWFGPAHPGPRPVVVTGETESTANYAEARRSGRPVEVTPSGIAADALGAPRIGDIGFSALQAAGAESAVVSDEQVIAAREFLWDEFRLLVEPAAAVPVAVLRSKAWSTSGRSHVGIVICGANTTVGSMA